MPVGQGTESVETVGRTDGNHVFIVEAAGLGRIPAPVR